MTITMTMTMKRIAAAMSIMVIITMTMEKIAAAMVITVIITQMRYS